MRNSSAIKHLFFWLSGAGTETLEACPNWEQRKYVAFGATVLVPCLFAFVACAYALSTLTSNYFIIFPVALVWSFIILTIDRALIVSFRPYQSFLRKLGQFTVRICVALLMGVTIAHPLVLLLFRDTISSVIEKDRQAEATQIRDQYTGEKSVAEQKIADVEKAIADLRERWNQTFQTSFIVQAAVDKPPIAGLTADQQAELKTAIDEATAPARDRLAVDEKQTADLTPTYTKLQSELAFWQSEFERELNGQRSGIVGLGPRAHSIQDDQIPWRRAEVARIGGLLEHLSAETATLQSQARKAEADAISGYQAKLGDIALKQKNEAARVTALRQKVEADEAGTFVGQQNQLRSTLKDQIDARIGDLKLAQAEVAQLAAGEQSRLASLAAEPRRDLLTQSLALNRLFKAGDQGGQFALTTYIILVLLFMLVDTIPLMIKFVCKPGPYDTLLDRDEVRFNADHRAFIGSYERYMNELSAGNLLAITRNKPLENALLDGVEHARAAREFLNSLIDLEKAFRERLLMAQDGAQDTTPEKIAVLEMMKKSFYDGLQDRMNRFFSAPHAEQA
jgi:uncharacterized membrane protein